MNIRSITQVSLVLLTLLPLSEATESKMGVVQTEEDTQQQEPGPQQQEAEESKNLLFIYNDPDFSTQEKERENVKKVSSSIIEGEKIESEVGPIYYGILANPNSPVRGVLFWVYGGGARNEAIYPIKESLARDGIIIVSLNLVDIKERELGNLGNQDYYPKDLLDRVIQSIRIAREQIHSILKTHFPLENIDEQLLKYYLTGISFGGSLTQIIATHENESIRNMFDGYISQAGASSPTIESLSRTPSSLERKVHMIGYLDNFDPSHLNVIPKAGNLSKPLLLMHGLREPNVHALNSIALARALTRLNKSDLVDLYTPNNEVHGVPTDPIQRLYYEKRILAFINNPSKTLTPFGESMWNLRIGRASDIASRSFGRGDLDNISNQFNTISLAYVDANKKNKAGYLLSLRNNTVWDKEWKKIYRPLLKDILLNNFILRTFQDFYINTYMGNPLFEGQSFSTFFAPVYEWFLSLASETPLTCKALEAAYDQNNKYCNSSLIKKLTILNIYNKLGTKSNPTISELSEEIVNKIARLSQAIIEPEIRASMVKDTQTTLIGFSKLLSFTGKTPLENTCFSAFFEQKAGIEMSPCQRAFVDWWLATLVDTFPDEISKKDQKTIISMLIFTQKELYSFALWEMRTLLGGVAEELLTINEGNYSESLRSSLLETLKTRLAPVRERIKELRAESEKTTETEHTGSDGGNSTYTLSK